MINDSYKGKILNSYETRIRGPGGGPQGIHTFDQQNLNGKLNNISKNFFLEQMLRTLTSKNKLMKMNATDFSGYDGTREGTVCGVLSDSSHLLAYCIFPT